MKPSLLNKLNNNELSTIKGNIVTFNNTNGTETYDSGVSINSLSQSIANISSILEHLQDKQIHITPQEHKEINDIIPLINHHINNINIHITDEERENWNNKIDEEEALVLINANYSVFSTHINNTAIHVSSTDRSKWNNTYSKEEINNKFSQLEYNNVWKEAVTTYSDIEKTYTNPQPGWTVSVNDTNIVYRFDGQNWTAISANSIPLATPLVDGKMSKEDKAKLDTVELNANHYVHPDTALIRHVTDKEKAFWNAKAEDRLATYQYAGLLSKEDKYKLDSIEEGATNFSLPTFLNPTIIKQDDTHQFVTADQVKNWDAKAPGNLVTESVDGIMSHYDKIKLNTVEANANNYIHPLYHDPSIIRQDSNYRFVTDDEKLKWNSKQDATPASATSDGYLSKEDKNKLDSIEEGANNYQLPTNLPASIITQDPNNRFFTDRERIALANKKNSASILTGTGKFNSTNGTIINHEFDNTSFSVSITPTMNPDNRVGQIWVEKTNQIVTVYCSGSATDITFDYTLIYYD